MTPRSRANTQAPLGPGQITLPTSASISHFRLVIMRLNLVRLFKASWSAMIAMALLPYASDGNAQQSSYPNRPIRIIVGTSPSGGTDLSARLFGQQLGAAFGQPVVIENRAGASGLIGMELVAKASPDGHTLLVLSVGHLMSASLTPKVAFDVARDFRPISLLASTPMLLAVHPSVPARTLADLIKIAKAPGSKLSYASGGAGGVQHLATELFKHEAKVDLLHVPYKGSGPGVIDLLAGNVQITMTGVAPLLAFINSGRLRALAITGTSRAPALPDVPTFSESGLPGVVIDGWHGMLAPARTPEPTVRKLAGTVSQVARMPEVRARLASEGAVPVGNSPDEFAKFFASERQRWTKLAETLGIKQ